MSLRSVIFRHGRTCQVLRQGSGTYDGDGIYVPAPFAAAQTITAVVQPLSGRQLRHLPEGQSAEDTRVLYTTFELKTRGPGNAPDKVVYQGDEWRVYQVLPWDGLSGGPHYVAYVVRQTTTMVPV